MNTKKDKAPNFAILTTKGGTGKTFIATDVIAPHLLNLGHNPVVRTFDDHNHYAPRTDSKIKFERVTVGTQQKDTNFNFYKAIEMGDEGIVIDVGGNTTCNTFIDALDANEDYVKEIDFFVIPVNNNTTAVTSAESTINTLLSKPRLAANLDGKIVIALNECKDSEQLESLKERYSSAFETLINPHGLKWIAVEKADSTSQPKTHGLNSL